MRHSTRSQSASHVQILGALSEDAARVVMGADGLRLGRVLPRVPRAYHSIALRTCFPSIEADGSLDLNGALWTADTAHLALAALPTLTMLTSLTLRLRAGLNARTRSSLSSAAMAALVRLPVLHNLELAELLLDDRGALEACARTQQPPLALVRSLVLLNCSVATHAAPAFSRVLCALCTLRLLKLTAVRDQSAFCSGVALVHHALPALTLLDALHLSGQPCSASAAEALASALCTSPHPRLQLLDLPYSSLDERGASALARALPRLHALQKLNLTRNTIGPSGAQALAARLPACSRLTLLDLWANGIGDVGAAAIARVLHALPALGELDLCSNRVTDEGARALARGLATHAALRCLNLDNNTITDEGALALASTLRRLPRFGTLYLCRNRLSEAGMLEMERRLVEAVRVQSVARVISKDRMLR
jgi:NLR family CARD domain-containing protein 3